VCHSVDVVEDTDDIVWPRRERRKTLALLPSSSVSRPKIAAVANIGIDIADITGSEISVNIDIDPALAWSLFTDPEGMNG